MYRYLLCVSLFPLLRIEQSGVFLGFWHKFRNCNNRFYEIRHLAAFIKSGWVDCKISCIFADMIFTKNDITRYKKCWYNTVNNCKYKNIQIYTCIQHIYIYIYTYLHCIKYIFGVSMYWMVEDLSSSQAFGWPQAVDGVFGWFLCQAEKTRAVDLLSELEGSIWVARSWFFIQLKISERGHTLNQTASSECRFFWFVDLSGLRSLA